MEHHSNIVPWQLIAEQTGAKLKEIPILEDGNIDEDVYLELLKNNEVKMVSMSHCSNAMGIINPLENLFNLPTSMVLNFVSMVHSPSPTFQSMSKS